MDYELISKELEEKGYCVVPNILSESEIKYSKNEFKKWQSTIPDHDKMHDKIDPHGIYKYHRAGHTLHAWFIRTRPQVQAVFKHLWKTDDLVVSFDGCCYISKDNAVKDKIWTHTDQSPKYSKLTCYQGYVALTDNKERTFRVYEETHKIHEAYFKERLAPLTKEMAKLKTKLKDKSNKDNPNEDKIKTLKEKIKVVDKAIKKFNDNWQLIDHDILEELSKRKRVLDVKAGSLVLWDSRTFHQNQYGKSKSEERMVQYVCYLPKKNTLNTPGEQKKRLKYLKEQRTTSHWPYKIKVNGLQTRTWGDDSLLIDYDAFPMNDLSEFEEEIMKII
tara:strand:- start:382 stop:1377 length:996 start_codon:yes stop_codon:yes gene_type:complete